MSAELEVRHPELPTAADMNAAALYAERLSGSMLLPKQYFKQPSNVLYAIEYGRMIGLAPMAAIIGVHVIEGKPSASAALISALVRRAGHELRVRGDAQSATCRIVRSDDPDFVFEVTFTIEDAQRAELTKKAVWRNYPASMLKARAITQCARDACEEALLGMHYTPEELGAEVDADGEPVITAEQVGDAVVRKAEREMVDAAPRGQTNPLDPDFELSPALAGTASSMPATGPQLTKLNILIGEKRGKLERAQKLALVAEFVGRTVASSAELTLREASDLIERLSLEPPYDEKPFIADAEFTEDPAEAEAAKLAATDPETDPERIEADLRDALESASSTGDIDAAWVRVQAAEKAGAISAAAVGRLTTAGSRREETLKADAGWSHDRLAAAGLAL
jgi:hypothetical protein